MYSCSKPQLGLFCNESQLDLLTRLLARSPLELPSAHLPGKTLLEGEGTPRAARSNLLCAQAQQQQISHEGDRNRALHPCRVLGDLVLAQPYHSFQFLDAEFDWPSPEIDCHRHVSCSLRPSGHEQFRVLGAVVTPPATEDHRDISDLPPLGTFGKGPEDPAPGAGNNQGHADLAVIVDRQMGDEIAQVLALSQLPGAREGNHKVPLAGLNGLEVR